MIDRADGVEDGHLWNPEHYSTPARRNLMGLMRRVQDHTADTITTLAGSMWFVYIHVIWFAVWIALFRVREVSVRIADDDRVARGNLPVDVRDDQPESTSGAIRTCAASSTSRTTSAARSGPFTSAKHWASTSIMWRTSCAANRWCACRIAQCSRDAGQGCDDRCDHQCECKNGQQNRQEMTRNCRGKLSHTTYSRRSRRGTKVTATATDR